MRLNTKDWGKGKKIAATLTVVCIGVFIIALIGSALSPDANTSSNNDSLKPSQYISMNDVDMINGNDNPNNQETEEGTNTENVITTLSDRNIYATCYDGDHDGPYAFNKEQVQMLAYYSNNTFNYSKIGVITHDEYEYKVVDHVFFENGTEMSAPTDENMTSISGIIEKGIKYRGNGHISQTFGMSEQEGNDYVASH